MAEAPDRLIPCPLCGGTTLLAHPAQPGYRLGQTFEVRHCPGCGAAHARPLAVDTSIYDVIYAHSGALPGYDRYVRYAEQVLEEADPLGFLAGAEDVYWSIHAALERARPGARILEVGSGLGYLTYALHARGFDATGMDISKVAVDRAKARYGPLFLEADGAGWQARAAGTYEVVVMTEILEHVPDPLAFLAMAAALVRPGGDLVVTTPNRSFVPPWVLWETEAPPVHLWWFSEEAMRVLAERLGMTIRFVDFAPFNRARGETRMRILSPGHPSNGPLLDEADQPLTAVASRRLERDRRPPAYPLLRWRRSLAKWVRNLRRLLGPIPPSPRRAVLCAVLGKPPS